MDRNDERMGDKSPYPIYSSRFDYVAWDEESQNICNTLKVQCQTVEAELIHLSESREKSMAITKLEETFMWIGKAIRSDQLKRTQGVKK